MRHISRSFLILSSLLLAVGMLTVWFGAVRAAANAPSAPPSLTNHSFTQVGNSLYMFGGGSITSTASSQLWRFDPSSSSWSLVSPGGSQPGGRFKHAAANFQNQLYILGGENQSGQKLDDVWRYDPATNTWKQVAQDTQPPSRSGHTAVSSGGSKLFVYGGSMITPTMPGAVWSFEPSTGYWSVESMGWENPQGTHNQHAAGMIGSRMYIVGGSTNPSADFVQSYDFSIHDFVSITSTQPSPARRTHQATAFSGSDIYIFGGSSITGTMSDSWRFNAPSRTWTRLPDLPLALTGAEAAVITSTSSLAWRLLPGSLAGGPNILIIGGQDATGQPVANEYIFDGVEYFPVAITETIYLPLLRR